MNTETSGQGTNRPASPGGPVFRASWHPREEGSLRPLEIEKRAYAAYIFDLDGTLLDTMPLHYRAWNHALRRAGLGEDLDEALFYAMGGIGAQQATDVYRHRYGMAFDADRVEQEKDAHFDTLRPQVQPVAAIAAFARGIAPSRPLSVASGAPRGQVIASLRAAGVESLFGVVVTAEDVARGKPQPDLFLLAASRMAVPPGQCLVFEDAAPGIAAAEAAGMDWVQVLRRASRSGFAGR
jgi:HAD superfamily hydrolase (TIGR01509 family)